MMKTIKKVGVMSAAKFTTILFVMLGIILLLTLLVISIWLIIAGLTDWSYLWNNLWESVKMTLWLAVFGFAFGALGALTYNLVAKWSGGLKIKIS